VPAFHHYTGRLQTANLPALVSSLFPKTRVHIITSDVTSIPINVPRDKHFHTPSAISRPGLQTPLWFPNLDTVTVKCECSVKRNNVPPFTAGKALQTNQSVTPLLQAQAGRAMSATFLSDAGVVGLSFDGGSRL
jgi:hypothetical protein